MGRKFGFSWSWKRAVGLSSLKQRISRSTGVPLTKQGMERKIGRLLINLITSFFRFSKLR